MVIKIFHTNTIILLRRTKQNRFVPRPTKATHMSYTGRVKAVGKGEAGGNVIPSAAWRPELETIVTMTSYYGQSQLLLCNSGAGGGGVWRRRKWRGELGEGKFLSDRGVVTIKQQQDEAMAHVQFTVANSHSAENLQTWKSVSSNQI